MPIVVDPSSNSQITQIMEKDLLLQKTNMELDDPHLKFTYKVYYENFSEVNFQNIKAFYDAYYGMDASIKLPMELFFYILKDKGILVEFYMDSIVVGYIFGKTRELCVFGTVYPISEGTLLCIHKDYRNIHLTPYLINVVLKCGMLYHNVSLFIFNGSRPLKAESFTSSKIYYRPIHVDLLLQANFFPSDLESPDIYRTFPCDTSLYVSSKTIDTVKLTNTINTFYQTYFDIYEVLDTAHFQQAGTLHYHVRIKRSKKLVAHFVLYNTIVRNVVDYRVGYVHYMYFTKFVCNSVKECINKLAEHCKLNNLCDTLAFHSQFPLNDYFKDLGFLQGKGSTSYYMLNAKMSKIPAYKNGLQQY
ncbi:hypothetical protein EB118_12485 [bacterium]|nr:hypothetical protein [bacterium]NDG30876.1 hypothetical protein [bacterium]